MADPARGREPLSVARRIVAAIGILIMVFSGGCTLWFLGRGGFGIFTQLQDPLARDILGLVFLSGGVPFAIGLIVWRAARAGRGNGSSKPPVAGPPRDGTPSG